MPAGFSRGRRQHGRCRNVPFQEIAGELSGVARAQVGRYTPSCALNALSSVDSATETVKPLSRRCLAQPSQHSHPGPLVTAMWFGAAAKSKPASEIARATPTSAPRLVGLMVRINASDVATGAMITRPASDGCHNSATDRSGLRTDRLCACRLRQSPFAPGHSTLLTHSCGSGARPYWMSTSFLRSDIATGPPAAVDDEIAARGTHLADRRDHRGRAAGEGFLSLPRRRPRAIGPSRTSPRVPRVPASPASVMIESRVTPGRMVPPAAASAASRRRTRRRCSCRRAPRPSGGRRRPGTRSGRSRADRFGLCAQADRVVAAAFGGAGAAERGAGIVLRHPDRDGSWPPLK